MNVKLSLDFTIDAKTIALALVIYKIIILALG